MQLNSETRKVLNRIAAIGMELGKMESSMIQEKKDTLLEEIDQLQQTLKEILHDNAIEQTRYELYAGHLKKYRLWITQEDEKTED